MTREDFTDAIWNMLKKKYECHDYELTYKNEAGDYLSLGFHFPGLLSMDEVQELGKAELRCREKYKDYKFVMFECWRV